MRVLITGAAGFIGSSLSDWLLAQGHEVCGVDCFVDYYPRPMKEGNLRQAREHKNFRFIEGDLRAIDLAPILSDVEVVFHQAAQAGVRASWGKTFESYTNHNILATQRLLEACKEMKHLKRVVYASSSSVYGDAESFPTTEKMLPKPVSPYGVSKLAAEHLMGLYCSQFGVPTISLRYFTVFGPRQRPDMAFHRFAKAALQGEPLTVYGDGEQSRDFTFISDIVEANWLASSRGVPGGIYNLGGGEQATVNQVLEIIQSIVGNLKINREARQVGDARHTGADTALARADLGFSPKVSLKEGIAREIEWMEQLLRGAAKPTR